jgi:hypothetical protein
LFKVTLGNDKDIKEVFFKLLDTNIANKWYDQLKKNHNIYEDDRFTNWPNSEKNERWYIHQLNKIIDTVNSYDNVISERMFIEADQQVMNSLHKHFENFRGHVDIGTDWYRKAPIEIQNAVEKFNVLIHEYEAFKKNLKIQRKHPYSTIVCTFHNREKIDLSDEDYQHFTFNWKFATVYINYCEVGKPPLDVFNDKDEIVGFEAIRPQTSYSSDFMIKFGPDTNILYYFFRKIKFYFWCKKNKIFDRFTKLKSSPGMIPVAEIDYTKSGYDNWKPIDIVYDLSTYDKIIKVSCLK